MLKRKIHKLTETATCCVTVEDGSVFAHWVFAKFCFYLMAFNDAECDFYNFRLLSELERNRVNLLKTGHLHGGCHVCTKAQKGQTATWPHR